MTKEARNSIVLLAAVAAIFVFWHFRADAYNVDTKFSSSEHGFSILYPDSWTIATDELKEKDEASSIVLLARSNVRDIFKEHVFVSLTSIEPEETLEDLVDLFLEDMGELGTKLTVQSEEPCEVNGQPAVRLAYKLRMQLERRGVFFQFQTLLVLRGDKLFEVTCSSPVIEFRKHADVFNQILLSFQLT